MLYSYIILIIYEINKLVQNKMGELKMERITSFSVDHRKLTKGVYVSRIDGDLITKIFVTIVLTAILTICLPESK